MNTACRYIGNLTSSRVFEILTIRKGQAFGDLSLSGPSGGCQLGR